MTRSTLSRFLADGRGWRWVLGGCALLTVAPLWTVKHLPFTDLPEHVATMATLAHWFDPSWPDAGIYALSGTGTPYLAYHLAGALLTRLTGDALLANRVILTVVGVAMPYATRELLRAFGGDERLALFGCTAFWCRPLVIGFLPFLAAVPVTLYVMALAQRQREAPTTRRAWGLAALTVLVFYLHLDPFLLIVGVTLALNLVPWPGDAQDLEGRIDRLRARVAWLVPAVLAAGLWLLRARAGATFLGDGPVRFLSADQLAAEFPAWSSGIWRSRFEILAGMVSWGLVLALAWHGRSPEPGGARGLLVRFVPFACALVLFALLPFQVGVTRMLNVRFAVLLLPTLLVVVRPDPGRLTGAVLAAVVLLTAGVVGHAFVQMRAAERGEIAGLDDLLAQVTPGARLLSLPFDRDSRFATFPPWTKVGALHRLRGGGVASVSFAEVPHWPIHYRPESRPPGGPGRDLEWHPCTFRNSLDGPYFDYVLTRGAIDPFRYAPPGPAWTLLARAVQKDGPAWSLFKKVGSEAVSAAETDPGPCGSALLR